MSYRLPLLLLASLSACESGTATVVDVEVGDALARSYSSSGPGVLVTDAGVSAPAAPMFALCGDVVAESQTYSHDFGFGCLPEEREGVEERVRVWVEPMPEGWDAGAFCDLVPYFYDGLRIGPEVTGEQAVEDSGEVGDTGETEDTAAPVDTAADYDPDAALAALGLATEPDPAWPQAAVDAAWESDFSPCGGVLRADVSVD